MDTTINQMDLVENGCKTATFDVWQNTVGMQLVNAYTAADTSLPYLSGLTLTTGEASTQGNAGISPDADSDAKAEEMSFRAGYYAATDVRVRQHCVDVIDRLIEYDGPAVADYLSKLSPEELERVANRFNEMMGPAGVKVTFDKAKNEFKFEIAIPDPEYDRTDYRALTVSLSAKDCKSSTKCVSNKDGSVLSNGSCSAIISIELIVAAPAFAQVKDAWQRRDRNAVADYLNQEDHAGKRGMPTGLLLRSLELLASINGCPELKLRGLVSEPEDLRPFHRRPDDSDRLSPAPEGKSYHINPDTGKVELCNDADDAKIKDDAMKRGWYYYVDPINGSILPVKVKDGEWDYRRLPVGPNGSTLPHYRVDPKTGVIEKVMLKPKSGGVTLPGDEMWTSIPKTQLRPRVVQLQGINVAK